MFNLIKDQWIGILAVVIVGVVVAMGSNNVIAPLGSGALTTISNPHKFSNTVTLSGALNTSGAVTMTGATDVSTFTQGGGVFASSTTASTATALESWFDTEIILEFTPNVDTTLTLPATSTITDWIPNAGDSKVTYIKNASSTAAAALTIAAGAGIDIQEPTGADLVISGLDWARLTWIRESDTDIVVIMEEFIEGD